jgi:carbon monoxide dehydrogenase subunit G
MEMTGERALPVDRATAWAALNDVAILQRSIPGCESIVATGENAYDLTMNAAIGPVKARFKGRMTLADVDPPNQYTIRFEGQGGQAGFARGDARVSLEEQGGRQTLLRYAVKAQVGGRLAQVGSRLIDAAAGAMAEQFFGNFSGQLATVSEPSTDSGAAADAAPQARVTPAPARLSVWAMLVGVIRRLFKRPG